MAIGFDSNAGTRSNSASANTRTPTNAVASDGAFVWAMCGSKNNETHSWSGTGWTKLSQVNSGAGWTVSLGWAIASGANAPTISWTTAVACFAQVMSSYLSDLAITLVLGPNSSNNNGTTSTHSCTGITTTAANSLAIYLDAAAANTAIATPAGWTEDLDNGSATGATRNADGELAMPSIGSTGDISVTGANAAWVMFIYELTEPVAVTGSSAYYNQLLRA